VSSQKPELSLGPLERAANRVFYVRDHQGPHTAARQKYGAAGATRSPHTGACRKAASVFAPLRRHASVRPEMEYVVTRRLVATDRGPLMAALAIAGLGIATLVLAQAAAAPEPVLPESFEWASPPGNPRVKGAWVIGAERAPGLYAFRVVLGHGGRIPPHTHPDTRYSTVLSGTLYVGFGEEVDESAMVAVPPGAVYVAPANQPHYLWARDGEVVYQEAGFGPTGTEPVVSR